MTIETIKTGQNYTNTVPEGYLCEVIVATGATGRLFKMLSTDPNDLNGYWDLTAGTYHVRAEAGQVPFRVACNVGSITFETLKMRPLYAPSGLAVGRTIS